MRAVLVGVGDRGGKWCPVLLEDEDIELVVVDKKREKAEGLSAEVPFYSSLVEALGEEESDFLVNATPPQVHNQINRVAFDHQLPVLSEKPIADKYGEARKIVREAQVEEIPFQIAENYRQFPIVRATKKHIHQGKIGELKTIKVEFRKKFQTEKTYFKQLEHPLLLDVSIHHFDLLRYLSGCEGEEIFAQSFSPKDNWLAGKVNLFTFLQLETDIAVNYTGTLVGQESETSWLGDWKLEGTEGMIILRDHKLCLIKGGEVREISEFKAGLNLTSCLDNFLFSLTEGKNFGTKASDYLKTQHLVELARRSSEQGKMLSIENAT